MSARVSLDNQARVPVYNSQTFQLVQLLLATLLTEEGYTVRKVDVVWNGICIENACVDMRTVVMVDCTDELLQR